MNYKIGLYNPKIEDKSGLEECKIIFDDFQHMKRHLRINDTILLKSGFSIYGIDSREIIKIIDGFELNVEFLGDKNQRQNFNKLTIATMAAVNDYIKENIEQIKRL